MARMIMVDRNGEENAERDVNTTENTGDTMRGETGPKNETGSRARMRGSMTDTYDTYNRMENRSFLPRLTARMSFLTVVSFLITKISNP